MSDLSPASDIPSGRSPWQRRVIDPIVRQLVQGITPEKIALTLAVGSALALFPILGTTTLLCLLAGILLRLNQPIIQFVNALCTPVHLPVILGFVRLGCRLFGVHYTRVGIRRMQELLWESPREFVHDFGVTAMHAIVAWSVVAPIWILFIYLLAVPVLREMDRRRLEGAGRINPGPPTNHPVP